MVACTALLSQLLMADDSLFPADSGSYSSPSDSGSWNYGTTTASPDNKVRSRGLFLAALAPIAAQAVGLLFTNLINRYTAPVANNSPQTYAQNTPPPSTGSSYFGSMFQSKELPSKLDAGLVYSVARINQENNQVEVIALGNGVLPRFTDKEKMAIVFASNLPGKITLTNIEPSGKSNPLGDYSVYPGKDNRFPKNIPGMNFYGDPGIEEVKMDFYPCLTPEILNSSNADAYKNRLPMCSTNIASKSLRKKGINNPEANNGINMASTSYNPDEIISVSFKIDHVSSSAGNDTSLQSMFK